MLQYPAGEAVNRNYGTAAEARRKAPGAAVFPQGDVFDPLYLPDQVGCPYQVGSIVPQKKQESEWKTKQ